jgi:hypothetical protein
MGGCVVRSMEFLLECARGFGFSDNPIEWFGTPTPLLLMGWAVATWFDKGS